MRLKSAAANLEDAEFIDKKIKEMEEFLRESKAVLGIEDDTTMREAQENKKRELGAGFDTGSGGGNEWADTMEGRGMGDDDSTVDGDEPPAKKRAVPSS